MRAPGLAFTLAFKDLRQVVRDRRSLLILLLMPLLFTLFFGFIFGRAGQADARLPVLLVVEDRGALSGFIAGRLSASRVIRVQEAPAPGGPAGADEAVTRGEYAAAAVIPAGYTQAVLRETLQGGGNGPAARVQVTYDRSSPAGHTARNEVQAAVRQALALVHRTLEIERAAEPPVEASGSEALAAAVEQSLGGGIAASAGAADELVRPVPYRADPGRERGDGGGGGPTGAAAAALAGRPIGPYEQASPGMIVQFVIFGLMYAAAGLVAERHGGTLARLSTLPLGPAVALAGKFLGIFAVALLQELILVGAGRLLFGLDYFARPGALLAMLLAFGLFAASFGLLMGLIARREEEVTLLAFVAMIGLSALGGAWFPLEGSGAAFRAVSLAIPTRWAMIGFQSVLLRAEGFSAVALPALALLGFAAALLAVDAVLLRGRG